MEQVIQTGPGIRLVINGKTVGFATRLNFTRSVNTKFTYELDSPIPKEITPTTYACNGVLTGLRLTGSGGLDGYGIMNVSTVKQFFSRKYAVIEVIDRKTDIVMFTIQQALFEQDTWDIQARKIITFSANFKGIFISNETSEKS